MRVRVQGSADDSGLFARFGSASEVTAALVWIDPKQTEAVQHAAIAAASRFDSEQVTQHLTSVYARLTPAVRSAVREALLTRSSSTLALLQEVERGRIPPDELPFDQLQRAALHHDATIDSLVRKLWGNVGPGTPEEKLADVRRLSNDLRAASGDKTAGRIVFSKHCAICHQLFGEGTHIGPELTKANRGDREALLISIVDPSSVIRKEYASYVVTTHDGQVITGLIAQQDPASITLLNARNERIRIGRDTIDELEELRVSLMPEKLLEQLTPQELRDLFAYLQQ